VILGILICSPLVWVINIYELGYELIVSDPMPFNNLNSHFILQWIKEKKGEKNHVKKKEERIKKEEERIKKKVDWHGTYK